MGSHESFRQFPEDLQNILQRNINEITNSVKVHSIIYPAYETHGSNPRQVQLLMDWLMLNASSVKFKYVYLLAHSMGGLLAADAFRYLYKLQPTAKPESQSLTTRITSSISSLFSYSEKPTEHTGDDMRVLVNIEGIFAFDSPYFGLHRDVLFKTGLDKAREGVKEVPKNVPAPLAFSLAVEHLLPNHVHLPIGTSVDTSSFKERIKSTFPAPSVDEKPFLGAANINLSQMANGSSMVAPIVGAATIASPLVVGGLGLAATAGDRLVNWASFLDPLLHSQTECENRVLIMAQQHLSDTFYFKGYYNLLPPTRTFCIPPPDTFTHNFTVLSSPLQDEVDAHMHLFDRQMLGGEHYHNLLDQITTDLLDAFKNH